MKNKISRIHDRDFEAYELLVSIGNDCQHIALMWLNEENDLRIAHKNIYSIELLRRDLGQFCMNNRNVYIADTSIALDDAEYLIKYLEANFSLATPCAYGYNSEGYFFGNNGLARINECGTGLTCGSFIVKLVKDYLNTTLFEDNFEIREADILRQRHQLQKLLENIDNTTININDLMNEIDKFQFFPPVMVMAALLSPATTYPLSREDVTPAYEELLCYFESL
ncbi:hypothetical protein [Deefgea rivuli]|uniref:hypothetical protein n=1 Tax=Deefgea rivuli TaxID=400948 RepID=UPI00048A2B0C|nr:hypothetical protein [Deefgea rivuli]